MVVDLGSVTGAGRMATANGRTAAAATAIVGAAAGVAGRPASGGATRTVEAELGCRVVDGGGIDDDGPPWRTEPTAEGATAVLAGPSADLVEAAQATSARATTIRTAARSTGAIEARSTIFPAIAPYCRI